MDIILFTGGVGENQMECRREVCKDMEFMGIELDNEVNAKVRGEEAIISDVYKRQLLWSGLISGILVYIVLYNK